MTRALLLCLLGVAAMAAGAGYEWGWGWAAMVGGASLLVCGLLYDIDGKVDQEVG